MRSQKSLAKSIVIAAVIHLGACQSWKVEPRPVEAVVSEHSGPVAVTMTDRRWVVLRDARLANDSIVGIRIAGDAYGNARTALALNSVSAVERRRFSFMRPIGAGVAAAVLPSLYRLAVVEND